MPDTPPPGGQLPVGEAERLQHGEGVEGEDADRKVLPDVQPEGVGGELAHDDLVGSLRVGHPPFGNGETVLIEQIPIDAAGYGDAGWASGAEPSGLRMPASSTTKLSTRLT